MTVPSTDGPALVHLVLCAVKEMRRDIVLFMDTDTLRLQCKALLILAQDRGIMAGDRTVMQDIESAVATIKTLERENQQLRADLKVWKNKVIPSVQEALKKTKLAEAKCPSCCFNGVEYFATVNKYPPGTEFKCPKCGNYHKVK